MISVTLILPTQNPWFPPVVPLDCWVVLRDYLISIYLVLQFFTLFWVIFDVKTAKIEMELSPIITDPFKKLLFILVIVKNRVMPGYKKVVT